MLLHSIAKGDAGDRQIEGGACMHVTERRGHATICCGYVDRFGERQAALPGTGRSYGINCRGVSEGNVSPKPKRRFRIPIGACLIRPTG